MSHQGDKGDLPHVRGFSGHVGTGQYHHAVPLHVKLRVIRDEPIGKEILDHWVPAVGYADVAIKGIGIDGRAVSGPCWLYAITVYANASNSYANIHDSNATSSPGDSTIKVEVGQATQYASTRYEFTKPLKFENGIYIDNTNGSCWVEYRK